MILNACMKKPPNGDARALGRPGLRGKAGIPYAGCSGLCDRPRGRIRPALRRVRPHPIPALGQIGRRRAGGITMAQLKTDVRALVVGGGAVGTGIAYHLQKAGWDTMLLE